MSHADKRLMYYITGCKRILKLKDHKVFTNNFDESDLLRRQNVTTSLVSFYNLSSATLLRNGIFLRISQSRLNISFFKWIKMAT